MQLATDASVYLSPMGPLFLFAAALGGFFAPGKLLLTVIWPLDCAIWPLVWSLLLASLPADLRDTSCLTCTFSTIILLNSVLSQLTAAATTQHSQALCLTNRDMHK